MEFLATQKPHWNEAIGGDFPQLAHTHQQPPRFANSGADWTTWLVLGGRGAGKMRAGSEWVRNVALADGKARIAPQGWATKAIALWRGQHIENAVVAHRSGHSLQVIAAIALTAIAAAVGVWLFWHWRVRQQQETPA